MKAKLGENTKLSLEYLGEGGVEGNKWLEDSESEMQPCTVIKSVFVESLVSGTWPLSGFNPNSII